MGYYMRFIVTGEQPVTVADARQAFTAGGPDYRFEEGPSELTVSHGDSRVADITFNAPGDSLFDEERDELVELVEEARGRRKREVLEALRAARQILAVQVLFGGDDVDTTLRRIDPLWAWLTSNRTGLIQADGEGYYGEGKLILKVE